MNALTLIDAGIVTGTVDIVKSVMDAIKEAAISGEVERTKREAFRQQALIAIAQIEANTSKFMQSLRFRHEERMAALDPLKSLILSGNASVELLQLYTAFLKDMEFGKCGD